MPTIDELPAAVSVSDGDELMLSQSDIARKATRAQVLAGVQPQIALPSGNLLGRMSPGIGGPEAIALGANLTLNNGAISAPAAFTIGSLSTGTSPNSTDQIPLGQGGQNAAISYATFMSGLSTISGINASNLASTATGGSTIRSLSSYFSDALSVESFGAVGDGITDDTASFIEAIGSGRALRLDGRTYVVNGPLDLTGLAIVGIPGQTIIRRAALSPSTYWIEVSSQSFEAYGITFDAGTLGGIDMPAVIVNSSCLNARFLACDFVGGTGTTTGCGLSVTVMATSSCTLQGCSFGYNALHGIYVNGDGGIEIENCQAVDNGGCGIRIETGVACIIRNGDFSQNSHGISVAGWSTGAAPIGAGPACVITGNICDGNLGWGIAVAAVGAIVADNVLVSNGSSNSGGGLLGRLGASQVVGNLANGGGYGADLRGCWALAVTSNHISNAATGLAAGGSQNLTMHANVLLQNGWAVVISAIEPSISVLPTGPLSIAENWIGFSSAQGGGISVLDAAAGVAVISNDIHGWGSAGPNQAIWLHTDAACFHRNRWNNQAQFAVQANPVAGLEAIVIPDVADEVFITNAPLPIASIITGHQADTLGQLVFVKVTAGGAGYTHAQIAFSGSGTGASAQVIVSAGEVVWVVISNPGSGYGQIGSLVTASITGDGTGATATAYAGLPVLTGRQLRLSCNCIVQLALAGSSPPQQSWTGYASSIPAFGLAELEGVAGGWRAVSFPPVDYVAPTGDGGAIIQSVGGGNLILRPSSGGALHFSSSIETGGCTSSVGRGSPLGSVAAPPGSDFRNLNGGAGNTFWIKQNNTDATGWVAVA